MGALRIIGGQWKRTPIVVHDARGLRPTPDRVRETLFNWLGQWIHGWNCLDLFAGAGSLGLEAGSRGAARVTLVEINPQACRALDQIITRLKATDRLKVVKSNAEDFLRAQSIPQRFDLIFMDPPFASGLLEKTLPLALAHLAPEGLVYVETDRPLSSEWAAQHGLVCRRTDKAGAVHYHLLQPRFAGEGEQDDESGLSGNL